VAPEIPSPPEPPRLKAPLILSPVPRPQVVPPPIPSDSIRLVITVNGIATTAELGADWELSLEGVGVLQVAPGDHLELSRGAERIEFSADRNGAIHRLYYVDGQQQRFGLVSDTILGDVLSTLIRHFGLGVEQRVRRVRNQSGVSGVLNEIDRLGHVRAAV